jgi:hypothetical protein
VADWATIASLATAGATLVLAGATFAAVRSANRAARTAERSLLAGLRPLLLVSRPQDPTEKVMWIDRHASHVPGGRGVIDVEGDIIYLALALRNAGSGIAVLHGWDVLINPEDPSQHPADPSAFHRLTRDLYVPVADTGFWQGAIRDYDDPARQPILDAVRDSERILVDVLYGDQEGGQRTITRFSLTPIADGGWLAGTARHWNLDRADPR